MYHLIGVYQLNSPVDQVCACMLANFLGTCHEDERYLTSVLSKVVIQKKKKSSNLLATSHSDVLQLIENRKCL